MVFIRNTLKVIKVKERKMSGDYKQKENISNDINFRQCGIKIKNTNQDKEGCHMMIKSTITNLCTQNIKTTSIRNPKRTGLKKMEQ